MRILRVCLVVAIASGLGCKKDGRALGPPRALGILASGKVELCKCRDLVCVEKVYIEIENALMNAPPTRRMTEEEYLATHVLNGDMGECEAKLTAVTDPSKVPLSLRRPRQ